ncbi:nucleoporin Nup186/Nup192/Nup205 [Microdochium trichocladiopsis]|uniref:Nucleoporin Nup186/Nup192/Nup205 n=1 Tax=Microdochium trichocladiopsis TaxID=1682393 RepID=A0A9P9BS99_9PEZI|nr:nucleoporin Nup186/Nup192/Nup205 [Microdochium trichocladiopsis]KAH7037690.1 nucleoporin Nup186/Nup192/Nup205 [Microdochium trichocladiopsis]
MAEGGLWEALQALHRDLVLATETNREEGEERRRYPLGQIVQAPLLDELAGRFRTLLDKPSRSQGSRDAVLSGKLVLSETEWTLNKDFQEIALQVADELDLDEKQAAALVLESEEYEKELGRSRQESAIIRFHQQRLYLLSCMRLLLDLTKGDDHGDDDDEITSQLREYVDANILRGSTQGAGTTGKATRFVPACITAMRDIKTWLSKLVERAAGASVIGFNSDSQSLETHEFQRVSLVQQHELLSSILCYAIERRKASEEDFSDFVIALRRVDKYDFSLVHQMPILGTFITVFGSTEGSGYVEQARKLNDVVCGPPDDAARLTYLGAAIRAWWVAEYSGWYLEDAPGSVLAGVNVDAEDRERSKIFTEALRDGAFDFLLALVADATTSEWQDPARARLCTWLRSRTPALPPDTVPFSDFLQNQLKVKLDAFVDAFISNMPDVLRRLRSEEDEQRQMRPVQEQPLDLERFLLIIAYAYEARPEAAEAFWSDPDSNLAGFLHWASRRASTPLMTAFCEMLQCLSEDPESATAAHNFLLDDGHNASGKMRQPLSLTWAQILKELEYFVNKTREQPLASQATTARTNKIAADQLEVEPETATMIECYLRLMAKLASNSEDARLFLHGHPKLTDLLLQLVCSMCQHSTRACAFRALGSFINRKTLADSYAMWTSLEACLTGAFIPTSSARQPGTAGALPPSYYMEALFQEISSYADEASSFVQLLTTLTTLPEGYAPLNDVLPFPEDLGSSTRIHSGIEPYIDFVLGHLFAVKVSEATDTIQKRILRFVCLDFALTCVSSFNEDLVVFGSQANIAIDSSVSTKNLATFVSLHPFSRVMEWMYDSRFIRSLLEVINQPAADIGRAEPNSPLILGVLRAVQLVSKVLDLQATYLDLVRPITKPQSKRQSHSPYMPTSNGAFASIEDGLLTSLTLVSDLGGYCGIGHPELTLASLKLLERISTSARIVSAWEMDAYGQLRRNRAIVALEEYGAADTIAGSFQNELSTPLDSIRRADAPEYMIKVYILDFLYTCLQANPDRPTIAHLLLGFHCDASSLSIEPGSPFDERTSFFHSLLPLLLELPSRDENGVSQQWIINLKYKVMRLFKILWTSHLSAGLVLSELRENDFLLHLMLDGIIVQQSTSWDGPQASGVDFLLTPAAQGYVDYLAMRAMAMDYMTRELCSVSTGQSPALKRQYFDALGGQVKIDGSNELIPVASVFEFQDSQTQEANFEVAAPKLVFHEGINLSICLEANDESGMIFNINKVRELLLLRRNELSSSGQMISQADLAPMEVEEDFVVEFATQTNTRTHMAAYSLEVLRAWTRLLLVMTDSNDYKGANKTSFILQTLQAILPNLELYSTEMPVAAFELAELAKVLVFKLDFAAMASADQDSRAIESLVSDKLLQLLQVCLGAITRWSGDPALRSIYYSICYRYLTMLIDHGESAATARRKTAKMIRLFGDKLVTVICDDASSGIPACQASALILLGTLVNLGQQEGDAYVVEALNKLNFIGVLVDSLREVMQEWVEISQSGNSEQEHYHNAKLALLSQLCQTRDGAKYVLHAGLFRAIEQSGLFGVDPELQVSSTDPLALERHYALLVKVTRVLGAAIISRASHNLLQGRRFLTEHRMLVMHVLKRSVGIGSGGTGQAERKLAQRIDELAEALLLIISATEFLEFEAGSLPESKPGAVPVFH